MAHMIFCTSVVHSSLTSHEQGHILKGGDDSSAAHPQAPFLFLSIFNASPKSHSHQISLKKNYFKQLSPVPPSSVDILHP